MTDQINQDTETVQDEFWTRKQAAEFLEVSEKAIQRYTNKNLLTVEYKDNPRGGGKLSVYRASEVRRLKNKDMRHVQDDIQDAIQDKSLVPTVQDKALVSAVQDMELRKTPNIQDVQITQMSWTWDQFEKVQELLNYLKGIESHISQMANPKKDVPIEGKLLLTVKEAAMLSNISQENLRKAIKGGALKAGEVGRGLKVRREDLNIYIANLY